MLLKMLSNFIIFNYILCMNLIARCQNLFFFIFVKSFLFYFHCYLFNVLKHQTQKSKLQNGTFVIVLSNFLRNLFIVLLNKSIILQNIAIYTTIWTAQHCKCCTISVMTKINDENHTFLAKLYAPV